MIYNDVQHADDKIEKIIEEKNPNMENRDEEASKIGIGAVIFNTLSKSSLVFIL